LGVTASAAELNKMDGVLTTTAELNYVDGVTSNIQTQLNSKTSNVGDITGVTAGTNLTGGGTSGGVTVNLTASPNVTSLSVGSSEVISSARQLKNIASVDATTVAAFGTAGVGGGMTLLADVSITSDVSYIQYNFATGYDKFIINIDDWKASTNYSTLYARLTNSSNSLITSGYLRSENYAGVSSSSYWPITPFGAEAPSTHKGSAWMTIWDPLSSTERTFMNSYGFASTGYATVGTVGWYSKAQTNGIRFYGSHGDNITSASSGYRVWGVK
jgi:hypothetical protein